MVPRPGAPTRALRPPPLHPLVHGSGARLEAQEEVEAPHQAAVDSHGHHDERGHHDEAEDDQGRRAVVVQDGLAIGGGGVEDLERDTEAVSWAHKK